MRLLNDRTTDSPRDTDRESPRRTFAGRLRDRVNLPIAIAVISVVIIAINTLIVIRAGRAEREKAIASTIRENSNLAVAFEKHITRTIGIADAVTELLIREMTRSGSGIDLVRLSSEGALNPELVAGASIIDDNGAVVATSDSSGDQARLNATASTELAFHAARDTGVIRVGAPERFGAAGGMIPISRRINRPDGSFAGIVLLQMESVHFTEFYDEIPRRPDDVMALIGLDGILRARHSRHGYPSGEELRQIVTFARQTENPSGNFVAESSLDGVRRFVSYRMIEDFPFIAAIGVSERDALADATRRIHSSYLRSAVLTVIIAVFAFLLARALHRRERAYRLLAASEATLRAREQDFRTATESMPQLVWIAKPDGTHIYFNQQWIDYTGLSLEQSLGEGWKAAFEPGEQANAVRRWNEAVAKGEIYEAEYRLRRADGSYRWMLARALPLRDAAGQITNWFGTSTDIDNQVEAQAQLREAQQVARIGSWTRDPHTGVHTWSEELYHIFGLSPAEFTPTYDSIDEFIHPHDQPQYNRDRALSIATMQPFERDIRIIRRDGEVRLLHHRVAVETDRSGVGVRVHGTVQDVTEARAAEQQLREQADLLNLTRDAIIVRESDGTIRFWNHGAERLYGWAAAEVVGRRSEDFAYAENANLLAARKLLAQEGEWSGEIVHRRKDGSCVTVNSRWTAVPNEHGNASSVLVINTDMTEQKLLEGQILRTQRLESIGTLASGVAHDLNNILAPILMAAPLLRDEMSAEKRRQLVRLVETSAERGAAIVGQVLTFARGADGERVLVQPIYALKEVAELVGETFPKSITVHTSYPEDLALIEADPTQLHQVLLNLCVNARDAMPDGGDLSLSAENFEVDEHYAAMTPGLTAGPHLLLKISDTGPGIPEEIMEKIFDPFFTTKTVGNGTGLGLSTVLGIVQNHGGTINAESGARGTTFQVLLPAAGAPFAAAEPIEDDELPRGRGETILVVDDEAAIREVAEPLLRKHGYEVLLAEDGPAALTAFAGHTAKIDLVLTDLTMPLMSGIALARTIRKMQSDACIIISAGREDDCAPAEMGEIGVAATLPKPYTQAALLRLLAQVLSPQMKVTL